MFKIITCLVKESSKTSTNLLLDKIVEITVRSESIVIFSVCPLWWSLDKIIQVAVRSEPKSVAVPFLPKQIIVLSVPYRMVTGWRLCSPSPGRVGGGEGVAGPGSGAAAVGGRGSGPVRPPPPARTTEPPATPSACGTSVTDVLTLFPPGLVFHLLPAELQLSRRRGEHRTPPAGPASAVTPRTTQSRGERPASQRFWSWKSLWWHGESLRILCIYSMRHPTHLLNSQDGP